jgi:hypothetical protein
MTERLGQSPQQVKLDRLVGQNKRLRTMRSVIRNTIYVAARLSVIFSITYILHLVLASRE